MLGGEYTKLLKGLKSYRVKNTDFASDPNTHLAPHMPNIHAYLPKLNKRGTLFKPSASTIAQRSSDYHALIDALLGDDLPPVLCKLRDDQLIQDFFGFWRRDNDLAKKTGGLVFTQAPASMLAQPIMPLKSDSPITQLHDAVALFDDVLDLRPAESSTELLQSPTSSDRQSRWSLRVGLGDDACNDTLANSTSSTPTAVLTHESFLSKLPFDSTVTTAGSDHFFVADRTGCDGEDSEPPGVSSSSKPSATSHKPLHRPLPTTPLPLPPKLAAETMQQPQLRTLNITPALSTVFREADAPAPNVRLSVSSCARESAYEVPPPTYDQTDQHQLVMHAPGVPSAPVIVTEPLIPRRRLCD
jgi:hypothetical protein